MGPLCGTRDSRVSHARVLALAEPNVLSPFCNEMSVNGASGPQTALLSKLEYALSHSDRCLWLIRSCASL